MDALGNVTTYTYNANTNVLQSVQSPRDDTSNQANNIPNGNCRGKLASHSYTYRNNYFQALAYGNVDSVQYTYDGKGRMMKQTCEDDNTVF